MTTSHCLMGRYCLHLQPQEKFTSTLALNVSCCFYYYYYNLFCHSLQWFSLCASSYTEHLPEDSCRPQHADLWNSVTIALSDNFLMFSTIPFFTVPSAPTTTGITRFSYATLSVFLVLGLCTCLSFPFPSVRCFHLWNSQRQSVIIILSQE